MELRFRPDDTYCKPTCGTRAESSSLLVKVKRVRVTRKCKRTGKTMEPKEEIRTEVLAPIQTTFTFNNLCDFQYLPTETTKDLEPGEADVKSAKPSAFVHRPILDQVHFDKLVDSKWVTEGRQAPLFVPPAAFSRMDQPQEYQYRRDTAGQKTVTGTPLNIIGRTRQRRTLHAIFVNYDVEKVPAKPSDVALNQLKVKFIESNERDRVAEAFKSQPVWTKTGLNCTVNVTMDRLKFILPTLAFYWTSGPWRNQWTMYGYDPRKDRGSHQYQTLDYRVRLEGGAKLKVRAKRSYANYLLPYKSMNWSKPKTSTIVRETFTESGGGGGDEDAAAAASEAEAQALLDARSRYIFEDGMVPPHRQMFYQYKDILLPEAQRILRSCLLSEDVVDCNEKNGWYRPNTDDKVREIISKSVSKTLASKAKKEGGEKIVLGGGEEDEILEDGGQGDDPLGEIVDEVMEQEMDGEADRDEDLETDLETDLD